MSATVLAVLALAFDESSSHGFLTGKASAFPSANVSPVSSTMTACTCDQSNYGRVDGPLNRTATYLDDRTKHTAVAILADRISPAIVRLPCDMVAMPSPLWHPTRPRSAFRAKSAATPTTNRIDTAPLRAPNISSRELVLYAHTLIVRGPIGHHRPHIAVHHRRASLVVPYFLAFPVMG